MAGKSGREINATPQNVWKKRILSWEGILVLLFVVVLIFCRSISSNYTVNNVFREMPKYLSEIFLFFPMAFILMLGEIDISVGSIVCLAATTGCLSANAGVPFPLVVVIMLATGSICGIINGAVITKFPELPSMIVTLGTQIIFRGAAEVILGSGGSVSLTDAMAFRAISKRVGPFPYMFFLVVIAAVAFVLISTKMKYGREVMAVGSNRRTALYSGIKVKATMFKAYVAMGFFAGLAALFLTAASYGANTTTGEGFEMDAIAMAVFGGIATTGGKGNMIGGIIAAFIIVCLRIGLGQINMNGQLILLIIGILLIAAVILPNISASLKAAKKKKQQA